MCFPRPPATWALKLGSCENSKHRANCSARRAHLDGSAARQRHRVHLARRDAFKGLLEGMQMRCRADSLPRGGGGPNVYVRVSARPWAAGAAGGRSPGVRRTARTADGQAGGGLGTRGLETKRSRLGPLSLKRLPLVRRRGQRWTTQKTIQKVWEASTESNHSHHQPSLQIPKRTLQRTDRPSLSCLANTDARRTSVKIQNAYR